MAEQNKKIKMILILLINKKFWKKYFYDCNLLKLLTYSICCVMSTYSIAQAKEDVDGIMP